MFLWGGAGELQAVIAMVSWSIGVLASINGVMALAALHRGDFANALGWSTQMGVPRLSAG